MTLNGKAAIVTGSATGIGRSTALALARRGCNVVINYTRSEVEAQETVRSVQAAGAQALLFRADVSDDAAVRQMVAACEQEFGRLDVLVNAAGTTHFAPPEDLEAITQQLAGLSPTCRELLTVAALRHFARERCTVAVLEVGLGGRLDATNAVGTTGLAVGHTTSGAEELQKLVPGARVVKAFNTVFAATMSRGHVGGEPITLFIAGDDAPAKQTVAQLGADLGFLPIDAGPLRNARYLEPLAMQLIHLAYGPPKMGPGIALRLMRGEA